MEAAARHPDAARHQLWFDKNLNIFGLNFYQTCISWNS
jgi:hypothetical protein